MCVPRATSNVLRLPLWFSVLQGRCRANTGAVETFLIVSSWTRCSPSNQGCGLSPLETRSANQGQTQHARSGHIGLVSSRAPPATRRGHQRHWRETARQDTKTPGTPGTEKGGSTSSPTGSPSRKPVTTGKTHPACRARQPRPHTNAASRTVTSRPRTSATRETGHLHGIALDPGGAGVVAAGLVDGGEGVLGNSQLYDRGFQAGMPWARMRTTRRPPMECTLCRRSANSLGGRSRYSAPGPGVDGAAAAFLSSIVWGHQCAGMG